MKTYTEKIESLRREIILSIATIFANNNLDELEISEEIDDPAYVVYFDDNGAGYDCKVHKVYIENGQLSLFVINDDDDIQAMVYSSELGCENLDWLNNIRKDILFTLGLKYKRICSECGKPMDEGYCIDSGMEYFCSDECLHKHYTPEEWKEMYGEGDNDSYWTKWEGESNLREE